jgi:hypothetical protein
MAAPIDAGSIYSDIRIRLDRLNGDIKSVKTSFDKVTKASTDSGKKIKKTSKDTATKSQKSMGKFFSFIKKIGVGSIVSMAGAFLAASAVIRGTVKFFKDSEAAATDAVEVYSKFDTVFESIGESANQAADEMSESFGIAGSTARELLSSTGDLLVGFGFTEEAAFDLAKQTLALGSDLASFTNFEGGAKRATDALNKALVGESESVKALGIVIRQDTKDYKDRIKHLMATEGVSKTQAKALAALQIATEQSGKAIGDTARTWDSAANTQKRLTESTKGLKEAVGAGLLPTVTSIRNKLSEWADAITEVINKSNELRDANKAAVEGNATRAQTILLLENEIEIERERLQLAINSGRLTESTLALKADLTAKSISSIQSQIYIQNKLQEDDKENQAAVKAGNDEDAVIALRKEAVVNAEKDALTELTARQFSALEPQEQKLSLLNTEIDRLAALKQEAKDFGEKWSDIEALIIDLINEKNALIAETTDAKEKESTAIVKLGEDYLSVMLKEKDGIVSVDDAEKLALEGHFDRARAKLGLDLANNKITVAAYLEGIGKVNDAEKKSGDDLAKYKKQALQATYDGALTIANDLQELSRASADAEIADIDRNVQAQLAALGLLEDTKIQSLQKRLDKAIELGDTETANDLQDSIDRQEILDQAEKDKAEVLYQAALEQWKLGGWVMLAEKAIAIQKAISSAPFPWNIPAIIATTASSLIQGAAHDKAKPQPPSFETGGIVLPKSGGSLINVAENGSPELMLNSGSSGQKLLQDFADQIVNKMGVNQTFQLVLPNGRIIAEAAAPSYNSGNVPLRIK